MNVKTTLISAGIFLSLFVAFALYNIYKARPKYEQEKAEVKKNYYLKYRIQLKGIIVDKRSDVTRVLTNNYFTYTIKISESNVSEHDVRDYKEDYYLLVKGDTAKFVNHSVNCGDVGDSIIVNYVKGKQYVWSGKAERRSYDLPIFEINYNSLRRKSLGW